MALFADGPLGLLASSESSCADVGSEFLGATESSVASSPIGTTGRMAPPAQAVEAGVDHDPVARGGHRRVAAEASGGPVGRKGTPPCSASAASSWSPSVRNATATTSGPGAAERAPRRRVRVALGVPSQQLLVRSSGIDRASPTHDRHNPSARSVAVGILVLDERAGTGTGAIHLVARPQAQDGQCRVSSISRGHSART